MAWFVLIVFVLVYLGMMLGRWPGLALDRTGVALLGAVALLAAGAMSFGSRSGGLSVQQAWQSVDVTTIGLLLGLMILSAQFQLAGVYDVLTRRLAMTPLSPPWLLGLLIATAGLLSAILVNDIVCLAMTPILIQCALRRKINPVPLLLGLACAANIGSAATLTGNPQNMLIGQRLNLSFTSYMADAAVPAILGLLVTWGWIVWQYRDRWEAMTDDSPPAESAQTSAKTEVPTHEFARWSAIKAGVVLLAVIVLFLTVQGHREIIALAGGGLILLSRRTASKKILDKVDWQLLILFISLFIINDALDQAGWLDAMFHTLGQNGVDLHAPAALFGVTAVFSNLVSNVPAVMMLLPVAQGRLDGAVMGLASTLAGNFIIVGSIANIIVVTQARQLGVQISWKTHARTGVPVTLLTLLIAALWLWGRSVMG